MIAVVTGVARGQGADRGAIAAIGRYEWLALPLYLGHHARRDRPGRWSRPPTGLVPLQVEGAVMTLLVGLGIVFAWALFTEPGRRARARRPT